MTGDWNVSRLLDVSGAYWRGCAVQAGVRLQLFSFLGDKGADAGAAADSAATEVRATGLLLDALAAMGLLQKTAGRYYNTAFSEKFLVPDSAHYLGHIVLHHHHILDGWAQLDQAVTTGRRVERRSYGAEIERQSFLLGMFNLAVGLAPRIAKEFPLKGRKKLLDLGGGPGTYAIHFCMENPELSAVIFDRPTTGPVARQTVAGFGLTDRIEFIPGDFNEEELSGGPYDVIWMSHILHSNSYGQCGELIGKAAQALEPGGLLLIHDFILNDNKDGPEFAALFSLNMLVGTDRGRAYAREEIVQLLGSSGLVDIEHHSLQLPNDSSILSGRKP